MTTIPAGDPVAVAATEAVRRGDLTALRRLLEEHPGLAADRIEASTPQPTSRTLLHVATDWPGHHPRVAATIALLVEHGADVDARFAGPHEETPLHWAASCDDVEALDALLDAGADIEAPGAVLGGGSPIADARGFAQWAAARRLLERGATTTLIDAATLGLDDRVHAALAAGATGDEIGAALWGACHGGRRSTAELLLAAGADPDHVPPWSDGTPLDAAREEGADDLVAWLRAQGARSARDLGS
ncbi:ankyrin repeat domain-containing protein [Actinomycetospora soli]|uniref:ankyrin repeat domain-containing protein n=1 Tax=Actinomycetospora soli TaxID=2893887 RepID=UPI001E5CA5AC|nr:ankyrin repeat domain-containing protein [Actinomycetospora soli]MCD2189830.1 ankyrin repeat domain-containing protein [Actinomycetospora soli]